MRIAHVTSGLDRNAAGVGVVVSALSAEQQSKGHEVRVFGLASEAWMEGDDSRWQGAPTTVLRVASWPRSFGFAPHLLHTLLEFDPDVVHLHGLWMYPSLAVLRWHRRTGKPYIYSPHGMLSPVALSFSPWKKRVALFLFQDATLSHASVMHCTTETEARELRQLDLKNQIVVLPHGIQSTTVPLVEHDALRSVLSLGRFHPQKGLDRLIEAWCHLENRFPGWTLDLVGPDVRGHKSELEKLAAARNAQRITFRSPLHGAERDSCMAKAELFVLPTRGENFALTVAESLMMETPVIATYGAPWSGLVEEKCGWWIEQNVDTLIFTLDRAMSLTDEQRRVMGKRGRKWMLKDFSWHSIADRMLAIYQDAINKAP